MTAPGLPELTRLLDPRAADVAHADPIADAVNIPLDEIPRRTHELPAKPTPILVAAHRDLALETISLLESIGRRARLAEACLAAGVPKGMRMWEPNPFLVEVLAQLPVGRAADLGCGAGRDTVFMAACGWDVLAVNRLTDALDRGRDLAQRYLPATHGAIEWRRIDLSKVRLDQRFDLVVMLRYLHRPLIQLAGSLLNPGGTLLVEAFSELDQTKSGKAMRPDSIVKSSELPKLVSGLQVVRYVEAWHDGRHTARLCAAAF